ncbi:hypothetical protein VE04_06963 [Pseudogymnoascus sp. 24MN13]|nr:hypothetical protein VE04_06963 [Pseudogymnoascus sp. 24MN13]
MLTLIDSIKIHETASASSLPTVSSPSLSLSVASSAAQQSASTTVGVGLDGQTFTALYFMYHPSKQPRGVTWRASIRGADYAGLLLFIAMDTLILRGIAVTPYL